VVQERESELFDVVLALRTPRRLAGALDRGKQQPHENANDRDDDKHLDQSKRVPALAARESRHVPRSDTHIVSFSVPNGSENSISGRPTEVAKRILPLASAACNLEEKM
jgi:hypothetical protein